jgi:hypothetical protein
MGLVHFEAIVRAVWEMLMVVVVVMGIGSIEIKVKGWAATSAGVVTFMEASSLNLFVRSAICYM